MNNKFIWSIVVAVLVIGGLATAYLLNSKDSQPPNTQPPVTPPKDEPKIPSDPTKPTAQTTSIKIYFSKSSDTDCSIVYPVTRQITKTTMIGTAALKQLFMGPTTAEKNSGYVSIFSTKTSDILTSLQVKDGTAYVNLKDIRAIIPSASASCGSAQFLSSTESTLKQFSTVDSVIHAINKSVETFYEWMQIGCNVENKLCDNSIFKTDMVKVSSPTASQLITSPVTIKGEARGTWFFEASFPIKVLDQTGKVIGQGIAQASSNWMTSNFVPFTGKVTFSSPTTKYGVIVLEKDNPSGLAINDDSVRLFVRLK